MVIIGEIHIIPIGLMIDGLEVYGTILYGIV
ncbi:uncharacterized protein METZ01_LOCUS141422 [marine metagenome]|uniref:Uncharacterized protein n=1 Tax=marine metagenome TaxID=408172 RepID=A0A381ZGX3_9ZZZZ